MDLNGQVALVTGATSGLGRHFAKLMLDHGATVFAAGRREAALESLVAEAGDKCMPLVMDVTDPVSVQAAFSSISQRASAPLTIVVNNAGLAQTRAAIDLTPQDWDSVLAPNLTGAFLVAQQAATVMTTGGTIINVASILGERVSKGLAAYAASKAGLIQLTKALALEWASRGIRVNALAPGYIETDLNRAFFQSEAGQRLIARIPQKRLGSMTDLNGPLMLLASDQSVYMTGSVIAVDGGHLVSGL
jgi:NAD(P)-dependent dehydrogenase (short-subunit alcohol dehydrogenase family)